MWLLVKYSLQVVMQHWHHNVLWVQTCLVATSADSCWISTPVLWQTSYGSPMTNCWSFTIAALKNAQNDHFHTLVGIAWLLHLPARQCTSTHRLRDGSVFGSQDAWFHATCCVVLVQWTLSIWVIKERKRVLFYETPRTIVHTLT